MDTYNGQAEQDKFVLHVLQHKQNGYFLEIGSNNPITINNTYLLEKVDWQGIIVDPINYSSERIKLRKCIKDNRAVYSKSGLKLPFLAVQHIPGSYLQGESWSGILEHIADTSKKLPNKIIDVETVSLNDLLEQYNAPNKIDYISIDTEGSEFKIINNLNFNNFNDPLA